MAPQETSASAALPAADRPTASLWTLRAATALAAGGVLLQIAYVLIDDEPRRIATLTSVVLFALAGLVHAIAVRGVRWGLSMALTVAGLALLVEAVGTATGFPFGAYSYTGTLGVEVAGVPLLIPLAWLWMAYPSYLAGQALGGRRWGWLIGAWTLAAWDLFVDPQMVDAGYWTWDNPTPALPGIPGIPLTNYAGWLGTAILDDAGHRRAAPPHRAHAAAPRPGPPARGSGPRRRPRLDLPVLGAGEPRLSRTPSRGCMAGRAHGSDGGPLPPVAAG